MNKPQTAQSYKLQHHFQ